LVSRHPRAATPYAWSAMWNVLRVTRGWVSNTPEHAQQTLGLVGRAMDLDPQCSLALAMAGFVHCHLRKDINQAQTTLSQALTLNPNESLAWLFSSVCHAFKGEGAQAMPAAEHAARLSPLDPLKYYYDSLAATAALSLGDYLKAHALATRSLRANKAHSSTLRALAVSSVMLGDVDGARAHTAHLLALEPGFSIKSFLSRSPSDGYAIASEWAKALRIAGAPES
jgi:adenylate cyclase